MKSGDKKKLHDALVKRWQALLLEEMTSEEFCETVAGALGVDLDDVTDYDYTVANEMVKQAANWMRRCPL